jgi:hypothetical protein
MLVYCNSLVVSLLHVGSSGHRGLEFIRVLHLLLIVAWLVLLGGAVLLHLTIGLLVILLSLAVGLLVLLPDNRVLLVGRASVSMTALALLRIVRLSLESLV